VLAFVGYDDEGKPVQASKTVRGGKRDAERLAAQLASRPAPRSGKLTVAELLDEYREHKGPGWSLSSRRDYASRAERIKADQIAEKPVSGISVSDVDRWHLRMHKAGVGDAQIRNLHTLLQASFGQAVRWELLPTNPVANANPQRRKKAPRGVMSIDEVALALATAEQVHPWAPPALRLAAVSGARRSELAGLRWDRIVDGRLIIDQAVTIDRTHPVGDPERLQVTPTKTGERRGLALDAQTLALVEAARTERSTTSPWIFGEDESPPSPDKIGWWWKRSRKLAGIDSKWRLHDLRHWSATHAIAGGHNVRSVAARLGHADPTTTMRTYAHALEGLDQPIADTVAGVLDGNQP
jgi:integrase